MNEVAVRFGEADLSTCDREPIHIPGSIQPHGALLVIGRDTLVVEQVAGDLAALLGLEPRAVLGRTLAAILDDGACAFVSAQLAAGSSFVAPTMRLGMRCRQGAEPLDLTLHAVDRTAILELEPAAAGGMSGADPMVRLKSLLAAVQHTATLEECCAAAAVAMRAATGFDRAMVYQFLPDDSGVVAAEDARPGLESFLGLHYPASDIPAQARELYRRNWLRAIPNIDYLPAPLLPATNARTGTPIDMSHCDLRSVSPIHLEYLRNMGVCASLSASIVFNNRLWGMLVLHHYAPRHVPAELRIACETFAQILSLHVESKVQAQTTRQKDQARRLREELVGRLTRAADIGTALASPELLRYLDATGAVVYFEGRTHCIGETPAPREILRLVEWLNGIDRPVFATENLAAAYPPAEALAAVASGLVAVGLSRAPRDYVLWFRPEMGRTVRWAGDPSASVKVARHGARLTPRGSFAEWLEVTRLHSAPWSEVDLEVAEALRVVFLENVLKSVELARGAREIEAARVMAEELEKRVAQRTEQLRALVIELEAVEDRERRQIARDLHDDLGQTLAAARIRLSGLCTDERAEVGAAARAVDELILRANESIRSLAAQLAPAVLQDLGLSAALEWLGEEIEGTFGLRVTVVDDGQPKPLAQESRAILYRAVRELLINVAKHAGTDMAIVHAESLGGAVVVRVSDRGCGYDVARAMSGVQRRNGLVSVRERLSLIGGSVEIRSSSGAGTVATLTAPFLPAAPHAEGTLP
jgi:light-regulated signal transduction histidine kinase (bacteriophytochrome)